MNKFGERRSSVRDKFHPTMNVEKMAAWLDGNLSATEMTQMAEQIQDDPMLEDLVAASDEIDGDIEAFLASGETLPDELLSDDFDIPNPNRWAAERYPDRMIDMACCAKSVSYAEYECCDAAPASAASETDDTDKKDSILDKIKNLLPKKDKQP